MDGSPGKKRLGVGGEGQDLLVFAGMLLVAFSQSNDHLGFLEVFQSQGMLRGEGLGKHGLCLQSWHALLRHPPFLEVMEWHLDVLSWQEDGPVLHAATVVGQLQQLEDLGPMLLGKAVPWHRTGKDV